MSVEIKVKVFDYPKRSLTKKEKSTEEIINCRQSRGPNT